MAHTFLPAVAGSAIVQPGAVVSKVLHRGEGLNVTVFAIDAGEGISEHHASRPAVVQVLSGRLAFTVDGEELDLRTGSWLHMGPATAHALHAVEPTVMLLTLMG